MNTSKLFIYLMICTIVGLLLIFVIQLISKMVFKSRLRIVNSTISFGIWYISIILGISIPLSKGVKVAIETIEIIYTVNPDSFYYEILKTTVIIFGITISWFLFCYFLCSLFLVIYSDKLKDYLAIDNENYVHFIRKGALLVGMLLSFMAVYETILRMFIPNYMNQSIF